MLTRAILADECMDIADRKCSGQGKGTYILGLGYRLKENCVVQEGSDEFDILISSSE